TVSWHPASMSERFCLLPINNTHCGIGVVSPSQQPKVGDAMNNGPRQEEQPQVLILGPGGPAAMPPVSSNEEEQEESEGRPVTEMVEQPAKVMRIGSMIRQLLEEVKAAPLDEASRVRLKEIHASSIKELEDGLAP